MHKEDSMVLRVPKAELPAELRENMIKRFGAVPESVEVLWHNPTVAKDSLAFGGMVAAWDAADASLKSVRLRGRPWTEINSAVSDWGHVLVNTGGAEGSRTLTGWNLDRLQTVAWNLTWAFVSWWGRNRCCGGWASQEFMDRTVDRWWAEIGQDEMWPG
jgi:hypothetical protein